MAIDMRGIFVHASQYFFLLVVRSRCFSTNMSPTFPKPVAVHLTWFFDVSNFLLVIGRQRITKKEVYVSNFVMGHAISLKCVAITNNFLLSRPLFKVNVHLQCKPSQFPLRKQNKKTSQNVLIVANLVTIVREVWFVKDVHLIGDFEKFTYRFIIRLTYGYTTDMNHFWIQ